MLAGLISFAFVAGAVSALQIALNVELARSARGPIAAALINFAVGLSVLAAVTVLAGGAVTALEADVGTGPWWVWTGGLFGATYVFSTVLLFPRLGAALTVGLFVTGQMLASLAIDQLGVLGVATQPLGPGRLAGGALAVLGVALMTRARVAAQPADQVAGSGAIGWTLLALAVGALLPGQGAVNAELGETLGSSFAAASVNFVVGGLALALLLGLTVTAGSASPPRVAELRGAPAWAWAGGICGALYVLSAIVLIPEIGAAATIALTVAGQQLTSLVMDHYGWLRLERRPVLPSRLAGGAVLLAGVALIQLAT